MWSNPGFSGTANEEWIENKGKTISSINCPQIDKYDAFIALELQSETPT